MEWLLITFALIVGAMVAVQPLVNAMASFELGHPLWGALVSAGVTLLALAVAACALRIPIPASGGLGGVPPWAYSGGLIGALMLFTGLFVAPKLGLGTTVALFIAGQLAAALIIDHFGWLGVPRHPVTTSRLSGALLLIAAVALIRNS